MPSPPVYCRETALYVQASAKECRGRLVTVFKLPAPVLQGLFVGNPKETTPMSEMLIYEQALLEGLSSRQKAIYLSEMEKRKKSKVVAVVLALVLGNGGIHQFYLRRPIWGIVYLVFCWTFVPAVIALIECFGFIQKRVDELNKSIASEAVQRAQMLMD